MNPYKIMNLGTAGKTRIFYEPAGILPKPREAQTKGKSS